MPAALPEQPRKRPVQSRSVHTVDAIVQAGIQVLLTHGAERLTTTRVAERAGVSVGTLYQYFPNKASLLAFALSRHLESVVDAVEAACARGRGSPLAIVAAEATGAFVDAKFADPDTSRALYAIGPELGAARIVAQQSRRAQRALVAAIAAAPDRGRLDPEAAAFLLATAPVGPVQALLEMKAPASRVGALRRALVTMAAAYLQAAASGESAPDAPPAAGTRVAGRRVAGTPVAGTRVAGKPATEKHATGKHAARKPAGGTSSTSTPTPSTPTSDTPAAKRRRPHAPKTPSP